jgi:putative SOS response-associated peptidase YedK
MCYDKKSRLRNEISYAERRGADPEIIARLKADLEELMKKDTDRKKPMYHASGFSHPEMLVFTNKDPYRPQFFKWGLIPFWVKDKSTALKLWNQTLNARGEEMWGKPSYRDPAKNKRCLIYVDAFYEHHHSNGKTYPFHISMKEDVPMILAGLWDEWVDKETGEVWNTATIVTCEGNPSMAKIHNNPKAEGPRMPVILTKENQDQWLRPCATEDDKKALQSLIKPFDETLLDYYSVGQLRGKNASGNTPKAMEKVVYSELAYPL